MKKITFLFILLCQFIAINSNAQGWVNFEDEATPVEIGITTTDFEHENCYTTIDSGAILLFLCSFIYCIVKQRRRFLKLSCGTLLMLLVLSCSKENTSDIVDVYFASENNKTSISEYGEVSFTPNDVLYMYASGDASVNGRYLGKLLSRNTTSSNTYTFYGKVTKWYEGETLYFYYIGSNTVSSDGTVVIDFSDQTHDSSVTDLENIANKFHVGSCKIIAPDNSVTTKFNGKLKNLISLLLVDTQSFSDDTNVKMISKSGLNNSITINPNGSIVYGVAGVNPSSSVDSQSGHIVIGRGSSRKYVSVLPASESIPADVSLMFVSNNRASTDTLNKIIKVNNFIHELCDCETIEPFNISSEIYEAQNLINYPTHNECIMSPYKFTVYVNGSDVKKVVISKGNLVYDCGRFKQHEYPWDICDVTDNEGFNVVGTFDRFGWATSGYDFGNHIFQPYSNSSTQYSGNIGYGYGAPVSSYKQSFHPNEKYRRSDWGWYQFGIGAYPEVELSPGNKTYWRTMGQNEWTFVFSSRQTQSINLVDSHSGATVTNARYAKVTVNGIKGVILFPDEYTHPSGSVTIGYINSTSNEAFSYNTITDAQALTLLNNGAAFLPFDGYYDKTAQCINEPDKGFYWTCKASTAPKAYCLKCDGNFTTNFSLDKYQGLFVRLVYQVEGNIF